MMKIASLDASFIERAWLFDSSLTHPSLFSPNTPPLPFCCASLSAMRPRSRLLSKRSLQLPTIREGAEEAVKELNEANSLHASSDDYFLSICHLAHPTFPARGASPYGRTSLHLVAADHTSPSRDDDLAGAGLDPLEYLYGHPGHPSGASKRLDSEGSLASLREGRARARAHSIPRVSSPELQKRQRKNSFPSLGARSAGSVPNISPERSLAWLEAGRENRAETPAKQSLISQWISDCRSAWRVARARACMLPAIAEV